MLIINGPNLNLLGDREKSKYGNDTLEMVRKKCESHAKLINAEIKFKPSTYLSFSTSYDRYILIKQFHWLESFYEDKDSKYHHIFSDIHRSIDVLTFRTTGNISKKLSVQGYLEIYSM